MPSLGERLTSVSFSSKKDGLLVDPPPAYEASQGSAVVSSKSESALSALLPLAKVDDSTSRRRLEEIAKAAGVELAPELTRFNLQTNPPTYMEEKDLRAAEEYIISRRATDPQYKPPSAFSKFIKSKAKQVVIDDKEINRALTAAVLEQAALSLVEALLVMGGSVDVSRKASKSIWKKMTNKDQSDRPSELLKDAVATGELAMVDLLASRAAASTLNEALLVALKLDSTEKAKQILQYGADASRYHDEVIMLIEQNKEPMVKILFLGPKPPHSNTCNLGLAKSVVNGAVSISSFLLACGAQASCYGEYCLNSAITARRSDLLVVLVGATNPLHSVQLDKAVAVAYQGGQEDAEKKTCIEICLAGGARGNATGDTLVTAVRQGNEDLVALFLEYDISVDHNYGCPLVAAITEEHTQILKVLLAAKPSSATLSRALVAAAASSRNDLEYCELLLKSGASVNFENGAAMSVAVEGRSIKTLELLLSKSPSQTSMTMPFQKVLMLKGKDRMELLRLLLDVGLSQKDLDETLAASVRDVEPDKSVIQALLRAQASPDYQGGMPVSIAACRLKLDILEVMESSVVSREYVFSRAITEMVTQGDAWLEADGLAVLQCLLENGADVTTLHTPLHRSATLFHDEACQFLATWVVPDDEYTIALGEAIGIQDWFSDESKTLRVLEILLEHGAKGKMVDVALLQALDAMKRGLDSEAFVDLFLQYGADVNYNDGQALEIATLSGNIPLLQKLIEHRPSRQSLSMAFSMAFVADH